MARPSTARAASFMDSDRVGWAWTVRARSSALPPYSMWVTAAEINSEALCETICTPRIRSVVLSAITLTIPSDSRISLLTPVQASAGGVTVDLDATMAFKIAESVLATLPDGLKATLVDGTTGTPTVGATFSLPANNIAVVFGDTKVTLNAATNITLHDGTQATIPAGIQVLLAHGAEFTLPGGSEVTLVKSRPLPVLFSDFFDAAYEPNTALVQRPYPVKDLDFTSGGAYSGAEGAWSSYRRPARTRRSTLATSRPWWESPTA